jgi:hypothetical protein
MKNEFELGDINYDPQRGKIIDAEVYVVDVTIDGVLYHVPCEDYDEAIGEGRTEYVINGDHVMMVSPEKLEQIKKAIEWVKSQKK